MKPINPKILLAAVVVLALPCAWAWQGRPDNTPPNHIGYHEVKTDASGKIVPWYGSGPSEAYDYMVRLVFHFWMNMRKCPERGSVLLAAPGLEARAGRPSRAWRRSDPDGAVFVESTPRLSWRSGGCRQHEAHGRLLAGHGITGPDLQWPNLPYPYNLDVHSGIYDGDMRGGKGVLQPDKAGSFAAELITLFKITGDRKYLDAAVKIADTLAAKVKPGDADHSPWPFRVNATTGRVSEQSKNGKLFVASYTTNYTGALRTFADLITMKSGNIKAYAKASKIVTAWMKEYPLKTNKWGPFFEDIPTADYSDTEINADTMAMYILEHPEWDPHWKQQAKSILDWSYETFANKEY